MTRHWHRRKLTLSDVKGIVVENKMTKHAYIRHVTNGWLIHLRSHPSRTGCIVHWEKFWYPTFDRAVRALPYLWRRK